MKNNKFIQKLLAVQKRFSDNEMTVYAGYATLYILMALVPLLTLIVAIINRMPWYSAEDFSAYLFEFLPDLPQVQSMLSNIITSLNRQSSTLVASVSALTTLWSASNGVTAIQQGLEKANGIRRPSIKGKPAALLFTLGYILFIPVILIFNLLNEPMLQLLENILTKLHLSLLYSQIESLFSYSGLIVPVLAFLMFLLTYTYLPAGKRSLKKQIPGALTASAACALFTVAFGFFIPRFWKGSLVYGSLAAVFLSAMWLKLIITIIFYGACLPEE